MTCWLIISDIIIQFTPYPSSEMVNYRRPVSARRSVRSRKPRAKRVTRKSYSNGSTMTAGRITGLSRQDFGFPDTLRTKLHYCDVVQLAASAGAPGIYQFRMNSLFDPDYTGTGHQPQWFDQLAAVYATYRVYAAKITATFVPNKVADIEANDTGPYLVGITTRGGNPAFGAATYGAILEDGNSVNDIIVDKQGGNNKRTLSNTFVPVRDLGIANDDDSLKVSTTSNPNTGSTCWATVWAIDMTELVGPDVVVKVEIEFMCEFAQRLENVNS